ncbi:MAG: fibronectin type III domain-containing protein [Candidatus Paceibacterota bacterium]|jgi:hypothetical protein
MNKIGKIFILSTIITVIMLGAFVPNAFATSAAPLTVTFEPAPLFNKPNFLPMDETAGVVTVTNSGDVSQTILTEAINIIDNDYFGSLLHLTIKEGGVILFDNSLATFFTSGEISLGAISNGATRTFTYTISFTDSSDNSYQGKMLGFDVCVGFEGGNTHCGNTVIGDEGGGTGGDGNGGGSGVTITGSGSGSNTSLIISNEQAHDVSNVDLSESATITWHTNKLSTSQVIYGLSSGSYTLNLTPPNFGYPYATVEDPVKVMNHSVLISGLTPGETYVYRVVSRASPPTISYEHRFTVPVLTQVNNQTDDISYTGSVSNDILQDNGESVLGNELNKTPESVLDDTSLTNDKSSNPNDNLAAVFASGFGDILYPWGLIIFPVLLAIYLIWQFWIRRT